MAGLRRDEVAQLAGISIEYYTRLERGNIRGVSDEVLDGIARALQLDEVERAHLLDLVRMANASPTARRQPARQQVRPSVQAAAGLDDGHRGVRPQRAAGHPGRQPAGLRAVLASVRLAGLRSPAAANLARFIFLDEQSAQFYRDWDGITRQAVGSLRAEAGRAPYDRALTGLVGELSMRSQEFRERWAAHDVEYYRSGIQPFHHPIAGDLDLDYDALEIPADPGQTIITYSAEPGSTARDALGILASWAAIHHQAGQPDTTHPADGHAPR